MERLELLREKGIVTTLRERFDEIRTTGVIPTFRERVEEVTGKIRKRGERVSLTRETLAPSGGVSRELEI